MARYDTTVENLRNEAQKRGVDPDRLVFMVRRSKPGHLARLSKADLALDIRVINGAATTSDALWAGVPVITLEGNHFASRISASILTAVGLSELIVHSLEEYKDLAVQLATDPVRLGGVRRKLIINRNIEPLFDTHRLARNMEQAYSRMWQIFQEQSCPRQFEVSEKFPGKGKIE